MKKSKINIIFSLLNVMVSAIQSLWLLSYVQGIMGVEAYGYIAVVTSVVNMANIITMAFASFTSRFVTVNLHQKKIEQANRYFNSSFFGLLIISVICGICFTGMSASVGIWMDVEGEYIEQVRILMLLTAGSFLLNTVSTPLKAGVYYTNKIYIMHGLQIGSYLSRIAFAMFLYNIGAPQLWYAYAGSFIFDLFSFFYYGIIYKKMMPCVSISLKNFRWRETKDILSSGLWVSVNKSGASLLTTVNTYLISIIVSAYMTGIYSTVTQFVSFVGMMTMALISCMVPVIYKLYADGKQKELYFYISKSMKFLSVFLGMTVGGLIVYERFLLTLMINRIYMEQSLLILLTLLEIPLAYPANVTEQVLIAHNKFTVPAMSQLIIGILNIAVIFVVYKIRGASIYTIVIAGCFLSVIRNLIFLPIYNQYISGYKKKEHYRQIAAGIVAAVITVVVSSAVSLLIVPDTWIMFGTSVLLSGVVAGALVLLCVFSASERFNIVKTLFWRND